MLIRVKADTALTSMSVDMMPVAMLTAINTNAANAELLWRLCWPLAALNLVLLAIPLSYTNPRAGRSLSMVIAVLIFILYLNGISIVETWVRGGKISWVTGLIALNGGVFLLTALLFVRRVWLVRWLPLKSFLTNGSGGMKSERHRPASDKRSSDCVAFCAFCAHGAFCLF